MENNLGNRQTLAYNLRRYMDIYGYTSKDIADLLDVKQSTVSYWINAKYYPRIDKIERLANIFHVNKSALVEEHTVMLSSKRASDDEPLLSAWHKATDEDKFAVYAILRKYGMPQPKEEDTTAISISSKAAV